jgi:hypothetical protein
MTERTLCRRTATSTAKPRRTLAGPAFDIQHAEKHMVGFDVVVPTAERQPVGALQCASGAVGELQVGDADRHGGGPDRLANLASTAIQRHSCREQCLAGRAPFVSDDAEQQVLGPDLAMPEKTRLFPATGNNHARTVAESVEHDPTVDETVARPAGGPGARSTRRDP